ATAADLSLSDFYGLVDKQTLVAAIQPWADAAMAADEIETADSPRERLFDVIMKRFEEMETKRTAVLSMLPGRPSTPAEVRNLLRARRKTADWALACAGLDGHGRLEMAAMRLGVMHALRQTELAWREDDSGDFARTMATLDAELLSIEERLSQLRRFFKPGRANAEAASPPEAPQAEMGKA
ncbi:MAG: hypothetical protein AAGJ50_04470, partial [Pseudomonadota bacterium]